MKLGTLIETNILMINQQKFLAECIRGKSYATFIFFSKI